jgi:hypothetical protein
MARSDIDETLLVPERAVPGPRTRRASRFASTDRRDRRLIVVVAILAAVAGALAPATPTGYAVGDAILNGSLAAVVVLATSRSRRWTWLWVSACGAVSVATWVAAIPAVLALLVSFWAAITGSRERVLGALVGALAVQSLLWSPPRDPYGVSALIVAVAVVPVVVSALRVSPRRIRRRVSYAIGAAVVVVVIAVAAFGVAGLLAARNVTAGLDDARRGLDAARGADDDVARTSLTEAADHFDSAHAVATAWWLSPAKVVPGLAQHARVLETATEQGYEVTSAGADVAASVDIDTLRLESGRLDLDMVEAAQAPLAENALTLAAADEALADLDTHLIIPPLVDRIDEFRDEVTEVEPEAELAAEVSALAPAMLGGDGERRYFVIFTQPAEARGLGGFMGSWAEITAVDGDLPLSRSGRTRELRDVPGPRQVSGPADYVTRYHRFQPWNTLQDVTLSPDFPSVASVMSEVYPQTGGGELDGVLAIDPYSLAALMEFTGPIPVEGIEFPLTADNAAEFLLREQYLSFGADRPEREDFLGEVTEVTFDRLTTGDLPSPREVSRVLHPLVERGRLVLWSRHPDEEALFDQLGATGEVNSRDGGDYLSVVTQNAANNKIDMFLQRKIDYQATVDPDTGLVEATVTLELHNGVPSLDLPFAVIGSTDNSYPLGTNGLWLNLYSPLRFVSATVNGEAAAFGSEREFDLWVYSQNLSVAPGETAVVEVKLAGVIDPGREYQLTIDNQPLVNTDEVTIGLRGADGWQVVGGDLGGSGAETEGSRSLEVTQDVVLEALLRRG